VLAANLISVWGCLLFTALVKEATVAALRESLRTNADPIVTMAHFTPAFDRVQPSVSTKVRYDGHRHPHHTPVVPGQYSLLDAARWGQGTAVTRAAHQVSADFI
jgi:hypothetical protein